MKKDYRTTVTAVASLLIALATLRRFPFPDENDLLAYVFLHAPGLFQTIRIGYLVMHFTTPFLVLSVLFSFGYIFVPRRSDAALAKLPPYPDPRRRETLFLVLGELHRPRRPEPSPTPQWLIIPDRGLYTGIAIFGAIGSGKTTGCIYPFANQILAYRASDPTRRIGGLVLEVKGDFCHHLRKILATHNRSDDYLEISLDSTLRYNPLYGDIDAFALAYGIASLLNNLYGRGKDPFWQQAYTNLVKFVILLHQVLYGYVTLFDVYECTINADVLEEKIRYGGSLFDQGHLSAKETRLGGRRILVDPDVFVEVEELEAFPFEMDTALGKMCAPDSTDLRSFLREHEIAFEELAESNPEAATQDEAANSPTEHPPDLQRRAEQFEAVKRWFYFDWSRLDAKVRTSIVEGISVFLSVFDDNPSVKRVFCPPKECYDPTENLNGRYGRVVPAFADLIEQGKVVAVNFPASLNPGLARIIGTLIKLDFQRALISRIPRMATRSGEHFREVLFLCDEYQAFATAGEMDPTGDEKFFALSRQAKCIPIVATQSISSLRSALPGESWRTLLQTFRTKIFLTLSDDFSAKTASELCGKEEQLKLNYTFSEQGQDAGISVLTGKAAAQRTSIGTTKSYAVQRDFVFEPKIFAELKNGQSIVLAYDGLNPRPPGYCYLKPYYLDPNSTYFEQLKEGRL